MILPQKRGNHPEVTAAVKIFQDLLSPIRRLNENPDPAADNAIKRGRSVSLLIDEITFGILHHLAFLHYQVFLGFVKPGKDRGVINDKDLIRVFFDNIGKVKEIHVFLAFLLKEQRTDYGLRKNLFNDFVLQPLKSAAENLFGDFERGLIIITGNILKIPGNPLPGLTTK